MMPIIAMPPQISPKHGTAYMNHEYCDAILAAGGLPVILPLSSDPTTLSRYAAMCHGLMLTGGHDIAPAIYGEATRPDCGEIIPERDAMELALLDIFLQSGKPVLGICRGMQLINARLGGSLYQHLPAQFQSAVEHNQKPPYTEICHDVKLLPPLAEIMSCDTLSVNSLHHQAIKSLSPLLSATAFSADGIVEALCLPDHKFFHAFQWHPEKLSAESFKNIFSAFVGACRG